MLNNNCAQLIYHEKQQNAHKKIIALKQIKKAWCGHFFVILIVGLLLTVVFAKVNLLQTIVHILPSSLFTSICVCVFRRVVHTLSSFQSLFVFHEPFVNVTSAFVEKTSKYGIAKIVRNLSNEYFLFIISFLQVPFMHVFWKGPQSMGFFGNMWNSDVCAKITGVTARHWDSYPELCNEILFREYEKYLVFTSFCVWVFTVGYVIYTMVSYFMSRLL